MSPCSTRYEQPLVPLKPKPRLARTLVEFDPRNALVPEVKSRHGAPHSAKHSPAAAGSGAVHSLPIPEDV
jgi:hypothetical protein